MNVSNLPVLSEVLLLELDVHADRRGHFFERFHADRFAALGLPTQFRQDNQSCSRRHVLRGLHYQLRRPQGKLLQCIRGAVFDVAVDIRVGSPTFGKWDALELTEERRQLLWIPPGFAHGFCALTETAELQYQCTDVYVPSDDCGIHWEDPALGIAWPTGAPILSDRDRALPTLAEAREALPRYEQAMAVRAR